MWTKIPCKAAFVYQYTIKTWRVCVCVCGVCVCERVDVHPASVSALAPPAARLSFATIWFISPTFIAAMCCSSA